MSPSAVVASANDYNRFAPANMAGYNPKEMLGSKASEREAKKQLDRCRRLVIPVW